MPCFHPIRGFDLGNGKPRITIECGQCSGCRLEKSREWATRCMHEAQMHKHNCSITLTYKEEHLPKDRSLHYQDFQAFIRRLRKALGRGMDTILHAPHEQRPRRTADSPSGAVQSPKVRFYMGGEYGEIYGRPHFHACLFGIDFADKIYNRKTPAGSKLYTSNTLDKLWKKGFASIGNVTFESAAYIARYIMKKRTGDKNKTHYSVHDLETGEIILKRKEFNQMSRRPGIGATWLEKYKTDVYPRGKVVTRGHECSPPRYYDKKYKKDNPADYGRIQQERRARAQLNAADHTDSRLAVQEQVQEAKTKTLLRGKAE